MHEIAGEALTLEQVLSAKERRAAVQAQLRTQYEAEILSMSLNMPGTVKYQARWLGMLTDAADELRDAFHQQAWRLCEERLIHDPAGATLLMAVKGDAAEIKKMAVNLEETKPWGRLLDLDVFSRDGGQINRDTLKLPPRTCLVCDEIAAVCVRSMRHDREAVMTAAYKLAETYTDAWNLQKSRPPAAARIGQLALEAMLMEVAASPAPGLVDRFNSGAHDDMDLMTFIRSSSALAGPMTALALEGFRHQGPLTGLLKKIRHIGIQAEHEMFKATYGVNTQKGLLFLLGILSAAAGHILQSPNRQNPLSAADVAKRGAEICKGLVTRELEPLRHQRPDRQLTAGEHYYLAHGLTGVRGEIEQGLPAVLQAGLPALRSALNQGATDNDAMIHALLALMTQTEDTTILHRHDLERLKQVQQEAQEIMNIGGYLTEEGRAQTAEMDRRFIKARVSPGGAADLLAVTWFLHRLEEEFFADGHDDSSV